jgi:acetyl-CoA C-acetyltransferase
MTRSAVTCEPVRTPIGRYGGMFKSLNAVDLGVAALRGLLDRTGIAPESVPGMQIDRRCGSGLQAVIQACLQIRNGDRDLVVAGVTQSMSKQFTAADRERTNEHGSGISLRHPVGATGGRMLATLARELSRREVRYGLETMCIGGGQGLAAVFERIEPR